MESSSDRGGESTQQQQQGPILSKEIVDHYSRHGVDGIEEFLISSETSGDGATAAASAGCRFVRLSPIFPRDETLSILRQELLRDNQSQSDEADFPLAVPWLNENLAFYAIPADFALARSESFKSGRVYGMDISSGAAVQALLFDDHDVNNVDTKSQEEGLATTANTMRVLDLCCSPGLKLCAIADCLRDTPGSTVVGVDVNESRLALCRNIVKKYQIQQQTTTDRQSDDGDGGADSISANSGNGARIRLYYEDGCQFGTTLSENLFFDSEVALEDAQVAGKRKRMNKSARARQQKRLRTVAYLDFAGANSSSDAKSKGDDGDGDRNDVDNIRIHPFDRVLVDAECSTDGAVKHLKHKVKQRQQQKNGQDRGGSNVLRSGVAKLCDAEALSELIGLQRRLIFSGFRLLKQGGVMVYSTCSLSQEQNEGVVAWLLQKFPDAYIIPVSFHSSGRSTLKEENVSIPGTVRFRPKLNTSSIEASSTASLFGGGFWLAKVGKKL